jgi:Holliday junction resolvase RusA-like endonuclease
MSVFNGRIVHQKSKRLMDWRAAIADEAKIAVTELDGAVAIGMVFVVARPKTVKRLLPSVKPDLDKYVRAVMDSLTGIAYADDSQVVSLYAEKVYGSKAGVFISIRSAGGGLNELP